MVGISLTMGAMSLDGLLRGLGQGAGIAMILIGVAVLSAHVRGAKQGEPGKGGRGDGMWLPSRDEDPK